MPHAHGRQVALAALEAAKRKASQGSSVKQNLKKPGGAGGHHANKQARQQPGGGKGGGSHKHSQGLHFLQHAVLNGQTMLTAKQLALGWPRSHALANTHVLEPPRANPAAWPHGYVAICAVVKDQSQDLREWIEYHKFAGIKKIYVYDHNSSVPLSASISDYMRSGLVEYTYFVGKPRVARVFRTTSQWWAYHDCLTRYRERHRWLAFIDADEFIVVDPKGLNGGPGGNLDALMAEYESFGGLALNWLNFGSSGHKSRPRGGVLTNYHMCAPYWQREHNHVKVIANTAHAMAVGDDPHTMRYYNLQMFTVNEAFEPVFGPKTVEPHHNRIALFHYLIKSEEDYSQKMARGSAAGNFKRIEFFNAINQLTTSECKAGVQLGLKCCPSVQAQLSAVAEEAQAAAAGFVPARQQHAARGARVLPSL